MKSFTKVLVCGGRNYKDYDKVEQVLTDLQKRVGALFIISGGATGADSLAKTFTKNYGLPCAVVEANWKLYNKGAGPIRNLWMLELNPDYVVAFPGGKGTADMIELAENNKVNLIKVEE